VELPEVLAVPRTIFSHLHPESHDSNLMSEEAFPKFLMI